MAPGSRPGFLGSSRGNPGRDPGAIRDAVLSHVRLPARFDGDCARAQAGLPPIGQTSTCHGP
eukprot:7736964-Pyramimonas_sp.AAC.1